MRALVQKLFRGNVADLTGRYGDIGLAVFVVAVVGMMILPLPTWLLDILLTLNIAVSVTLLMMALYVPEALRFSSFPTLLLVTTLFRLGLNVSSTRLILSQADAGEVIRAFGQFVTKGNLIVGAVVFLILTLIQFIVIAKGAERVAEVAARFTLDAMPGKQMSIDADLRAGAFDLEEARRRRALLQRESQLYGAMDGAMKFVKGDAIAGIVIIFVNIVGGLAVGVLQMGMSAGDAVDVYSLLTIGDGLVSQIPALIVSVAAGMIVTRVASEDPDSHLGKDIGAQIFEQPKALAVTSGLLLVLAVLPGLPFVPFLLLGGVSGLTAFGLLRARTPERTHEERAQKKAAARREAEAYTPLVVPIAVAVGPELAAEIGADESGRFLSKEVPEIRAALFAELGVRVPAIRLQVGEGIGRGYTLRLSEVPVAHGEIPSGRVFAAAPAERLAELGVGGEPAQHPGSGHSGVWVAQSLEGRLRASGIAVLDTASFITLHLLVILRRNAGELVGIQEVQSMLDLVEKSHPALVREVVPKLLSVYLLTDVLRRLVEEQVSIRDLRTILGALADWARAEKDPILLAEHVRASLRRYLSHRLAGESGTLAVYLVDPLIEETIRGAIQRLPTGSYLALDPEMTQDILAAIRKELLSAPAGRQRPVILTSMEIRRFVKRLCEVEFPDLAVVSYQELSPELQIQPVARIAVGAP
jgi:type III secretion protein V